MPTNAYLSRLVGKRSRSMDLHKCTPLPNLWEIGAGERLVTLDWEDTWYADLMIHHTHWWLLRGVGFKIASDSS